MILPKGCLSHECLWNIYHWPFSLTKTICVYDLIPLTTPPICLDSYMDKEMDANLKELLHFYGDLQKGVVHFSFSMFGVYQRRQVLLKCRYFCTAWSHFQFFDPFQRWPFLHANEATFDFKNRTPF